MVFQFFDKPTEKFHNVFIIYPDLAIGDEFIIVKNLSSSRILLPRWKILFQFFHHVLIHRGKVFIFFFRKAIRLQH